MKEEVSCMTMDLKTVLFKKRRKGPAYREKEKEWWTSGGGNIETQGKGLLYTFCESVATRRMES